MKDDQIADLAIGLRIATRSGLAVRYTGIRRFDLAGTPLEKVVEYLQQPDFPWDEPEFGKMRTALTTNVPREQATLLLVLDPSLDASYADQPVQPGNDRGKLAISDARLWPAKGETSARILSVRFDTRPLSGDGFIKFNLVLENCGELGSERQAYRTPIIIDPDIPWPPTNGGAGGGTPYP